MTNFYYFVKIIYMKKTKEVKASIKNKSKIKKAGKIAASILGASIFLAGAGIAYENTNNVILPSRNEIVQTIDDLDANARYITLRKDIKSNDMINDFSIRRLIIKNGETVKIKLDKNFSQTKKNEIELGVEYLNNVFSIINPSYKFQIVENRGIDDLLNENFVSIKQKDFNFPGITYTFNLKSFSNFGTKQHGNNIVIDTKTTDFEMSSIFVHEFMHVLGLGDAYKLDNLETTTHMNATASYSPYSYLADNDFKLLLALYSDNSNLNDQKFENLLEFKRLYAQRALKRYKQTFAKELKKVFESKGLDYDESASPEFVSDFGKYFEVCGQDNAVISYHDNEKIKYFKEYEAKYRIENSGKEIYLSPCTYSFSKAENFENLIESIQNNDNNSLIDGSMLIFKFGDYYVATSRYNLITLNMFENMQNTFVLKSLSENDFYKKLNNFQKGNFLDGNLDAQTKTQTIEELHF